MKFTNYILIATSLILLFFYNLVCFGRNIHFPPKQAEISTRNNTNILGKIGDFNPPGNPMNDRAKGYLLDGKIKSSILNHGNFIDWSSFPAGLWGNYAYLPHVGFMAGVPGHIFTSNYSWNSEIIFENENEKQYWFSLQAYDEWFENIDGKFVGIATNIENDSGELCKQTSKLIEDIFSSNDVCLFEINHEFHEIRLYLNTSINNPNLSASKSGLVYPWGKRPKLIERLNDFDYYDYGDDLEEWTEDDNYEFYGHTVSESWFSEGFPENSDWQPVNKARETTHNTEKNAGDIFGNTDFSSTSDTYPLLAHSKYSDTWPESYNVNTGKFEKHWPGWFAKDYWGDQPEKWVEENIDNCNGTRGDEDCWKESDNRFVADTDIYMEFDDRWAHRGNLVGDNSYKQKGYPLGIKVMAEAHSYGVTYAEDIMFVTVQIRNESGSWTDDAGNYHQGMIMPDGTILNGGKGFDYENVFLGFYFDSIVVWSDYNQNYSVFTNQDDYMEYYWDKIYHEGDSLLISLAMTYDYDGNSNGATDIGYVATQLLDTPLATDPVDLNKDGIIDIYPGEPLKMTDWHWFDWYNRPGVVERESGTNCCAGYPGRPQAQNKESIHYKIMAGDTTNLSENEKKWFFHTANPELDLDVELNPHFDSLDGLKNEPVFSQGQEGFDCIFIMSSGPFDLKVGETVPFSFCIIFGEDKEDLIANAEFAQLMYNSNYQGFTAPKTPIVNAKSLNGNVILNWDKSSIYSRDVLTGYSDFEGYRIYKSIDGGRTWGTNKDKIFDYSGNHVGWKPYAQFDLSFEEDSLHCIKGFVNEGCVDNKIREISIKGNDPHSPWINLGNDTGLPELNEFEQFVFIDSNVVKGIEYTYSITAYDMGISPRTIEYLEIDEGIYSTDTLYLLNPDKWARPNGYSSIESPLGSTINDPNFIKITPGTNVNNSLYNIKVVPNPYISQSGFNESEYVRKIYFTNLPSKCIINVYTITGEKVTSITKNDDESGDLSWDLRTINNQEISPGLYLFTVESNNGNYTGKFAVIR